MIDLNQPGKRVIMTGNEAIARGAMEAGVDFVTAYPGSPCVEVTDALFKVAERHKMYGEWSVNEIVALEAAAAASFAGLRSICVMKQNGMAVASDFLLSLNYSGTRGGMVIVVGDDPSAHSSINEVDSRHFARFCEVPLLEPSTVEEARDMTRWAFELSEKIQNYVIIRVVTRICHARGNLVLNELPGRPDKKVQITKSDRFLCLSLMHGMVHKRLEQAREIFENTPFNSYEGLAGAEAVIAGSGPAVLYAREALQKLQLEDRVGLLKIGASWPLPKNWILNQLKDAGTIIFVEETDPFLEQNLTSLLAQFGGKVYSFYGQASGHISGEWGPGIGELNVDLVAKGLAGIFDLPDPVSVPPTEHLKSILQDSMPSRVMTLCPGCPHRSSFWAIKSALEIDGREGFALGDIGCYSLGASGTGYWLLRSLFAMGSGIGLANGFGQLHRWGMDQPVLAVMGDSTFYHACMPALVNGRYNGADFIAVVLDNAATSMTGFQPHPGTGKTAMGGQVTPVSIEEITRGMGLETVIADPHQLNDTLEKLFGLMQKKGPRVLIMRQECALTASRKKKKLYRVDPEKCIGENCGCHLFCTRTFACPAIFVDQNRKAVISDVLCTGCGACSLLCPAGAIQEVEITEVSSVASS